MGPDCPLPLPDGFGDPEVYVTSLLQFCTTSQLLHTFCGGVHILDFLTRAPELYEVILPASWRTWFKGVEIEDVLDLLMRGDLTCLNSSGSTASWKEHPRPPQSLIEYVKKVRQHLLCRDFRPSVPTHPGNKSVFSGMNPKKVHEVDNFAKYVDSLITNLEASGRHRISHIADFGAGQNYLGRVLASRPYQRNIIAIESRPHVVKGAKSLDVHAKLTKKALVLRNKKAYRAAMLAKNTPSVDSLWAKDNGQPGNGTSQSTIDEDTFEGSKEQVEVPEKSNGSIQYIEHRISNGDLSAVVPHIVPTAGRHRNEETLPLSAGHSADKHSKAPRPPSTESPAEPSLLVMSLHSCGNLVHHGLRTLTSNPCVNAVALIGCCYNLMTERLGPPTHKLPLRPQHPRLDATSGACDPQGFPMSDRLATYKHFSPRPKDFSMPPVPSIAELSADASDLIHEDEAFETEEGIRLNITARMMAVQAPQNWTRTESEGFFTRHFFRALLQRIFLDKGVISAPPTKDSDENLGCSPAGSSWGLANGDGGGTKPVVIGHLKKSCYESFVSYVRGAIEKLAAAGDEIGRKVEEKLGNMSDEEILQYEHQYRERKKELSIVWSLMAFSAGVVEALIVVDRWLWLKEQPCVEHAWVEPVFDYAKSPRNLVVVGIKK